MIWLSLAEAGHMAVMRHFLLPLLLALCGIVATDAEPAPIIHELCPGIDTDVIGVQSVMGDLPARAGKEIVVHVRGVPTKEIRGGRVVLEIRALGLEVGRKTYDICGDLGVSCPIAQGSETLALFKYNVPWWAVTTVATLKLTATDDVGGLLTCVHVPTLPVLSAGAKGPHPALAPSQQPASQPQEEGAVALRTMGEEVELVLVPVG